MKYRIKLSPSTGPEAKGTTRLIRYMIARGWGCMKVGGGKYNTGWPDWYCYHHTYGHRWIEMKKDKGRLSPSQIKRFIKMNKMGDKIFVLRDERDYKVLFREHDNWGDYLRL